MSIDLRTSLSPLIESLKQNRGRNKHGAAPAGIRSVGLAEAVPLHEVGMKE